MISITIGSGLSGKVSSICRNSSTVWTGEGSAGSARMPRPESSPGFEGHSRLTPVTDLSATRAQARKSAEGVASSSEAELDDRVMLLDD